MKQNVGTLDRTMRVLAAIAIGILFLTEQITGALAIVMGIVAVALLVTGLVRWCPAYVPLGKSTCKGESCKP